MPNAQTHDTIALVSGLLLLPASGAAFVALGDPLAQAATSAAWLVGAHLICSHWLSPDLDIDSAIDNRWGPLRLLWLPYQKAVPHRHWFSHSGFSALLRLAYLAVVISLPLAMLGWFAPGLPRQIAEGALSLVRTYPRESGLIILGAVISDSVHTISDYVSTWIKRRRWLRQHRRRRRRSART